MGRELEDLTFSTMAFTATNSVQNKKHALTNAIKSAETFEDLMPMLKSLGMDTLESMLLDYIFAETTPNCKITKLYHESLSLTTIMPDAITQSVMAFLEQ